MVKPLPPTALHADRLEAFRAILYTEVSEENLPRMPKDVTEPVLHACNWCGTWMPLPRQATIAISRDNCNEALEATTAEVLLPIQPVLEKAGEEHRDSDDFGLNNIGILPETSNNLSEVEGLIMDAPMVCEVVSLMWGDPAQEKRLRAQRVAALRARWVGKCYTALPWLYSPQVSTKGQYTTDPYTGECKTQ